MYPAFDPAASLRIWAVETEVGGRTLRIPPLPAAEWLPAVFAGDPWALRDLVEEFEFADLLLDGQATVSTIREALVFLLESASGRTVIATYGIAGAAAGRWDVIGSDLARAGMRFDLVPLGYVLDAMYASLMRHMDEKAQAAFTRLLVTGPETPRARGPRRQKPLPANALQYVQTRPKTQLLPRPGREGDPSEQPTQQRAEPGRSGRVARTGRRMPSGDGDAGPQLV